MTADVDARAAALEFPIPDYANPPYGGRYGRLKATHRIGSLLMLGGITPEDRQGNRVTTGRLGQQVTTADGYRAARRATINALGMIQYSVGSLAHVKAPVRCLTFIAATDDYDEHHLVSAGVSDVLLEVFGEEALCAQAAIGVSSLSNANTLELWMDVELHDDAPASR